MKKIYAKSLSALLFSALAANAQTPAFDNPSVENWGSGCPANGAAPMWFNYSDGGSAPDAADYNSCPHSIPGAAQHGSISGRFLATTSTSGEGMYQMVSGFTIGAPYSISFHYAGSNLYGGGSGAVKFHLFIDDIDVAQTPAFLPSQTSWVAFAHNFSASAAIHKIGVRLYQDVGGATAEGEADNFVISSSVGMKEAIANTNKITVYPNPTNGILNIETNSPNEKLQLYNSVGELVFETIIDTNHLTLTTDHYSNGIYFLKIGSQTTKIIKE